MSATSNSALKVLNTGKYAEIFSNDNSHFDNPLILSVYRIFFQITKIMDDNLNVLSDSNTFITALKQNFSSNLKNGLGDYLKSKANDCNFNEDNVEKISSIMDHFSIKGIDSSTLAKLCKTTGIFAFFVKDALSFCGMDAADNKKNWTKEEWKE